MLPADLHTHSTASDGQYSPSQVVAMARQAGISVLALTDHDTVDGLEEAEAAAREAGLRFVRGVELSAREYTTFHILGYGFSRDAPLLTALCQRMKDGRDKRKYRILDYLNDLGFPLTLEEVEAFSGGRIIARPHFARAMVSHGWVQSTEEAFALYLDCPKYHERVQRDKPSVEECMTAIHEGGGFVSLAHPYQIGLSDQELESLVASLAGQGLDAIECRYSRHTEAQTAFYLHLAETYHLHITGGSDFHGERLKPDISLTPWPLDLDWLLPSEEPESPIGNPA